MRKQYGTIKQKIKNKNINLISKDQRYKNGLNPLILVGKKYYINGPRLHEYLNEINRDVLSNYDCMTVGETVFTTLEDVKLLTGEDREELSMVFNFDHTSVDNFLGVKWLMRKFSLRRFKKILDKYLKQKIPAFYCEDFSLFLY